MIAPRSGSPKKRPITRRLRSAVSAFLTTSRARIDRQVAYPAAKQKAKAASSASWSGYEEWKETKNLEGCTKTGAIVSITWDRGDEGTRRCA